MADPTTHSGPLAGALVVDLSRALAGPHAAMMLGDLGARVIKVEAPGGGDDTRGWGPPFVGPEDARESTYFLSCNRNKESIVLDLKDQEDRAVLLALVDRADVLVENFRTGVMDRLGLGSDVLLARNPRLVVLSLTGFGHDGPEGGRAGYDQIAQGEGGLMSLTGSGPDDPQKTGVPIGDLLAGIHGALGVVAALHERHGTGRGQVVRASLLSSIVGVHAFQGTRATVAGEVPRAIGNHHPSIAPYGLFRCKGGAVQISVGSEGLWQRFCEAFDLDATAPGFATNPERVAGRAATIALVEQAFAAYSPDELMPRLDAAGIPAGVVRTLDEVYASPQVRSQGLVVEVDHAVLGSIELPGPPIRFFEADGGAEVETTRRDHAAPPVYGADGDAIRAWLAAEAGPA
ncbi:MAG: CoA transferase [Micrococcales bacterium 73-13]|nr:MAG: CoA transferase [Micrococcales bacterium 73-13]